MGRSLSCLTVYVYSFSVILHGVLVSFTDGRCKDPSVLTGNAGDIRTPNYPNSYPSRSKCSWLIQVPVGYKIKLQFYHFVLEDTFQCGGDFFKVYDGRSSSAEPLGIYCGRKNPFHVESTSTNLFMTFKSDRTLNYAGFRATFSAIAVQPLRPLSFQRTVLNMTGVLGKDVKLLCQVKDGSANLEFSWKKDGLKLSNNSGPNYIIRSNAVNRRSHLRLEKLSQSDAGVYGCLARDLDMRKNISAFGTLTIKVPAVVLEGPVAVNVTGENLVISRCISSGDPVPKIRWQVNGQDAKANQTKFISELTIKAVKSTIVNCTADNGFGLDWKTAKINVLASPTVLTPTETTRPKWSAPLIIVPPKNLTAEKGDNVTLTCAAVGYPKPLIRWLVDERTYYENPLDDNMSHLTITISKDETAVKCEAKNSVAVDSKTAIITVPKVEASVGTLRSEGFFSGTGFVLVLGVAAVAVVLIVGAAIILYRRRKMQLQNFKSPVDAEKLQSNPIFDQHSNYRSNPKLLIWEVPRNRMEFIKELGQGNGKFSSIFLGKITPDSSGEVEQGKVSLVMVKLFKENEIEDAERQNFEEDALALTKFHHPCVQRLFGVCGVGYPLCLVFEFNEHDESLRDFLIESGRDQCSIHRRTGLEIVKPKLSNVEQISIAKQIANGMEYLAAKEYIHRELCTNNCIIGNGMVVKISNLGFSWKGPNSSYYSLDPSERGSYPVRWLPPETLQSGTFAEETDIWSFGVSLWEIYSSGLTPYYGMNDEEVISLVVDGNILPCPKECPKEMYEIMQSCWNWEPSKRPRLTSLHARVSHLLHGVPV